MLDQFLNDDAAVQRMRGSPLGSQLDAFAAVLSALGYARASIRDRLWTLAALGRWLKRRGLSAADLRCDVAAAFLHRRTRRRCVRRGDAATLRLFLEHLETHGIIPVPAPVSATAIGHLKARVPRARVPVRVPVVLSRDEVARIMKHLDGVMWLIVALLYGAGLRLKECLELRVKDIDLERRQMVIRRGKGQKDRATLLPGAVIEPISRHLEVVQRQHQADLARGCGRVVLPFALDRKYPNAATEWGWQFAFPAGRICTDPRWGPPSRAERLVLR